MQRWVPAHVLGAKRCDVVWCGAGFDVVNYTHFTLLCRNIQARKRSEWVWQQWEGGECCDDLGYSCVGSATAPHLVAVVRTTPHVCSSFRLQKKRNQEKSRWQREWERNACCKHKKRERISYTHNLSQICPPTLFLLSIFLYFLLHIISFARNCYVRNCGKQFLPAIFSPTTFSFFWQGWKLIKTACWINQTRNLSCNQWFFKIYIIPNLSAKTA